MEISNRQSVIQIFRAASSDILSTLSGNTFSFSLGLMLLHRTHSAISFGLGAIIYPLIGLLLVVPVGNLVDTYHHKKLILTSKGVGILALVVYAFLVPYVRFPMALAIGLLIVQACCDKVTNTTYTASIHELVNDKHVKTLATIEQAATAAIQLISPVLAAALYAWLGFEGTIRILIGAEILVWLISASMHFYPVAVKVEETPEATTNQWRKFRLGLVYIKDHLALRALVVMGVVLNFLFSAVDVGLPYAVVQERHMGNARLSLIMSSFAAGLLVGNLLLSVLPSFKRVLLVILRLCLALGAGIGLLGIVFLSTLNGQQLLIGLLVWGFTIGTVLAFINTPLSVYLQMTVPTELLGRVGSTFSTLLQLAVPLGTLVYGFCFQHLTAGWVYLITGIGILLYTSWQLVVDGRNGSISSQNSTES